MKKFENAKIEAIRFENAFIATSGCKKTNEHYDGERGKEERSAWLWIDADNAWKLFIS